MSERRSLIAPYFEALDSGQPFSLDDWYAEEFDFSLIWVVDGAANEFAGGRAEMESYFDQREPPEDHRHEIKASYWLNSTEFAIGMTSEGGRPLATFTFAVQVDKDEKIVKLYAARTTSLRWDFSL